MEKVLITKPRDKSQSSNQYENGTISEKNGIICCKFCNHMVMSMLFYSLITHPRSCASTTKE